MYLLEEEEERGLLSFLGAGKGIEPCVVVAAASEAKRGGGASGKRRRRRRKSKWENN